jgi:peptide/nickel transport system permease protein
MAINTSASDIDLATVRTQQRRNTTRRFLSNKVTLTGTLIITSFLLIAMFAPLLAPHDPFSQNVFNRNSGMSAEHWLGTDHYGRDVLSRVIWGTRVSLLLGVAAPLIAGIFGTILGTMSGYFGGRFDNLVMRFTDIFMSFPTLLLGIMIAATLGPGFLNVVIAISVALFPRFIRLARGSTLAVREEPYIEASIAAGASSFAVMFRHILPNISGPIIVLSTLWVATAIRLEASLSFLGLGTQPPSPSWGNMVRDGLNNLMGSSLPIVSAGLAITLAVLSFNMVGDSLRDALDPELRDKG